MNALIEKFTSERESKASRRDNLIVECQKLHRQIRTMEEEVLVLTESIRILDCRIHAHRIMETQAEVVR